MTIVSDLQSRRHDLDWLRIIAFGLLILYHMGMFFVTWDWHVKSVHAGPAIQPLMLLTSPWRLGLLFLIAGVATRHMAGRTGPAAMTGSRSYRLLLPLAFGMLVIVPPQTYYEIVEKLSWTGGWAEFYIRYLSFYDGWRPGGRLLVVPTWNHLWFVAYLWVYTMAVIALRPLLESDWFCERASRLPTAAILLLPAAVLVALRLWLRPHFPETHALLDDWYLHAVYFGLFLFGYAIAGTARIWQAMEDLRWPALVLALCCYAVLALSMAMLPDLPFEFRQMWQAFRALDQWLWIVMLLGFARRWLSHDGPVSGPVRRYLTDAVFPFYIIHQTVIVVVGHNLRPLQLSAPMEALVIFAATLAACFGGYEIVRRIDWLRPVFGLRGFSRTRPQTRARLSA